MRANDDPLGDWQGAAGEAGSRSAGGRGCGARAEADDGPNLRRARRKYDQPWDDPVARETVALVGTKLLRLGDHRSGADGSLDVADELRPHAEPTGIRYPSSMDVVCLGILVADAIARPVDELPDRGSLGLVDEISLHGGGCALNTASAPVRFGLSAGVVGKVGDDALGAFVLSSSTRAASTAAAS